MNNKAYYTFQALYSLQQISDGSLDDIDFLYDSCNIKREPLEDPELPSDEVNNYENNFDNIDFDPPEWGASGSLQAKVVTKRPSSSLPYGTLSSQAESALTKQK